MEDYMLMKLTEEFGTPLYVFNGDEISETYDTMIEQLGEGIEIFYSVKANPSLGICQLLKSRGSGIEVASSGELKLAIQAGFEPHKIIFSGPGKTIDELKYAVETGIASIIAESVSELEKLERLATENNCNINVGIRLNPSYDFPNAKIKMSGSGKQFGIDGDTLSEVIEMLKKQPHLKLVCLHTYLGTQIFDYEQLLAHVSNLLEIARQIIEEHDIDLKIIDFGGGFGIPYFGEGTRFDFHNFAQGLRDIYQKNESICKGRRLIFESGRYLLAESGYFLTQILYKKRSKGTVFLVTDGGMNHHVLSTFRGRQMRNNFPVHILGKTGEKEIVTIAGPLCTPDDIIGRDVEAVVAEQGDIVCIPKSGAYGRSFSPVNFLGHPGPTEVLRYKDKNYLLRERGKIEEILMGQHSVDFGRETEDGTS